MRVHVQTYIFIRIKCIIFPHISASSVFQIESSFAFRIFLVKDKLKTSFQVSGITTITTLRYIWTLSPSPLFGHACSLFGKPRLGDASNPIFVTEPVLPFSKLQLIQGTVSRRMTVRINRSMHWFLFISVLNCEAVETAGALVYPLAVKLGDLQ